MSIETNYATGRGGTVPPRAARSRLAIAAAEYARGAWHVFPLRPRGKEPLTAHGFKDATNDAVQVERWWTDQPNANIGLHCRHFTVLDVDPRNGGDETLEALTHEHGAGFKDTVNVLTGGGGVHYYYLGTTSMTKAGPGLDVKSTGGYVILPPSIHPSGEPYVWEYAPEDTDMLEIPDWLRFAKNPETAKIYEAAPIGEGDRNDTLVRMSGRLRALGGRFADLEVIEATLEAVNRLYCTPPLNPDEVRALAQTAKRWAPGTSGESIPPPEDIEWSN